MWVHKLQCLAWHLSEVSFLAFRWWVSPSPVGLMHPRPARCEASADLQSPEDRTALSAPARSLLELKPVVGEVWIIVPGGVLTKLYQESSEVYRENLGCPLSSPDNPYGEKVQKTDSLRNKLSPVSASVYFQRIEGKRGWGLWYECAPRLALAAGTLKQEHVWICCCGWDPDLEGMKIIPSRLDRLRYRIFLSKRNSLPAAKCNPVGLCEQPWFSVYRCVTMTFSHFHWAGCLVWFYSEDGFLKCV